MFKNVDDDEKVSVHEIARVLRRGPIGLDSPGATKLARYIVEPRESPSVEYDELAERPLASVSKGISELLGEYTVAPEKVQEALTAKVKGKVDALIVAMQEREVEPGMIDAKVVQEISQKLGLDLREDEIDYVLLTMYKKSGDLARLPYSALVEHLGELGCRTGDNPSSAEADQDLDKNQEKGESVPMKSAEAAEEKEKEKDAEQPPEEDKPEKRETSPGEEIGEDQMIEIAQKCFSAIAEKMLEKGASVHSLFKDVIYQKTVENEETELISPDDFLKGLHKLGAEDPKGLERRCLLKMLSASDDEKGFRVNDLVQILQDYGIKEGVAETEDQAEAAGEEELRFEDLDKVSMVLLLALTEYVTSAKVPLDELFGKAMYKQPVQIDNSELEIDVINSEDFFEVLHQIGIDSEEKEQENLKRFLCIDPSYEDKFSAEKLRAAMEEFATNQELRKRAQACYQELVEEEQLEEEPPADGPKRNDEGSPGYIQCVLIDGVDRRGRSEGLLRG